MSYKAILFGILLLLAAPAVSSAVPLELFYQASATGTNFCNNAATKVKQSLLIGFLFGDVAFEINNVMAIEDAQQTVIASLLQEEIFATSPPGTGAFMYTRNDGNGNISTFAGTFKNDVNTGILTSFTGTFNAIFANGCFENLTIKSGKQIVQ
ncbi:MAG TPA: hypothetical protein VKH64_15505 [Candidatus Binatia bacterium]|nr:hypothetical protein [Candidatus Binatia bacterium]